MAAAAVDGFGGRPSVESAEVSSDRATSTSDVSSVKGHGGARAWLWATVVITAGAFAAAIVMAPPASASPIRGLAWLLFLGSSVHVASTAWLYTLPEVRSYSLQRPLRYVWIPIGLILAAATGAAVLSPATMTWVLLPYFAWQFLHFQKQNLGMAALAASSRGVTPLRRMERRALVVAGESGIVALMARPGLLQLEVQTRAGWLYTLAGLLFVGAAGYGLVSLVRRPSRERPVGFCAIYLLSLLFSLPIFIFRSPYAAVGGMTIAHGLQYLLLMGLVAAGSPRGPSRVLRIALLCNVALLGGLVLGGASHLHGSPPAVRLLFGAYLGVVMAHFVIDGGFWRLRDPFPRQFLARHLPYLVTGGTAVPTADGSSADIP